MSGSEGQSVTRMMTTFTVLPAVNTTKTKMKRSRNDSRAATSTNESVTNFIELTGYLGLVLSS